MKQLPTKPKPAPKREATPRPKKEGDLDINEFLKWLGEVNIKDYPGGKAIIKRYQEFHRPGFIKDLFPLINEWRRYRGL